MAENDIEDDGGWRLYNDWLEQEESESCHS